MYLHNLFKLLISVFLNMVKKYKNLLIYEGSNFFRQRLILATLSGKSVKIKKIREKDDNPGVKGIIYKSERYLGN